LGLRKHNQEEVWKIGEMFCFVVISNIRRILEIVQHFMTLLELDLFSGDQTFSDWNAGQSGFVRSGEYSPCQF